MIDRQNQRYRSVDSSRPPKICRRLLFDRLSIWKVFQVLHLTTYTSSPPLRSPSSGACYHTWVRYELHESVLNNTDRSSQELCNGLIVHQPPNAGRRPGSVGAARWQAVCKKAIVCGRPDICEENETTHSVFLKGYTFWLLRRIQGSREHTLSRTHLRRLYGLR